MQLLFILSIYKRKTFEFYIEECLISYNTLIYFLHNKIIHTIYSNYIQLASILICDNHD